MTLPTQTSRFTTNRIARFCVLLIVAAFAVFFAGSWLAGRLAEQAAAGGSGSGESRRPPGSDAVFGVHPGIQPRYKILATYEDDRKPTKSMPTPVKRTIARIVVPTGLSADELEDNLRHANKAIFEKKPVDAQIVFAFKEGGDMKGPYTAGRLEFGPDGVWNDAAPNTPLDRFRATVDLDGRYFQKAPAGPPGPAGARPK
jgi:hypothetical protein